MPRGWMAKLKTSQLVKQAFQELGEAHPWLVWKFVKEKVEAANRGYVAPSASGIATTIRVCEKLGLLRFVKTEEPDRHGLLDRKVYTLVPEKVDAKEWENPTLAYYDPEKFARTRRTVEEQKTHMDLLQRRREEATRERR